MSVEVCRACGHHPEEHHAGCCDACTVVGNPAHPYDPEQVEE